MKRITKVSIIAAAALVVVGSFSGCSHFRTPENRAQWTVERVTDKLELNESQRGKLNVLKDEMMATRKDMKQKFGESRGQFKVLLDEPTLDQQQALSLVKTQTQYVDEQAQTIVVAFAGFYDSLDLEQQAKIREFVSDHDDHQRRWGGYGFMSRD